MADAMLPGREVIFEFFPVGQYMRVTAMDVASLTEIAIQGPVGAGDDVLKRNALKRLEYVLKKKGIIEAGG
jgi:hypothetical protein